MLKVGLTGGLASGKTFVAACFESFGAHVIHADKLGHEILEPDGEAFDEVVEEFGDGILADDGSINRKKLAAVVFPAPEKLERFREKGSALVGDVDPQAMEELSEAYTPVPGGVGPLTIAMLMKNTAKAAMLRRG